MEYTQADLDEFRVLVNLMEAGQHDKVDTEAAERFARFGWLQRTSAVPARYDVTDLGRQRLEPR